MNVCRRVRAADSLRFLFLCLYTVMVARGAPPAIGPTLAVDGSRIPSALSVVAVTAGSGQYLLLWGSSERFLASRVSADGTNLDPDGIPIAEDPQKNLGGLHAAFNGTNYLIIWTTFGLAPSWHDVKGRLLTPAGALGEEIPVAVRPDGQYNPGVASHSGGFLVVWDGHDAGNDDIYGRRLDGGGNLIDNDPFVICNAAESQTYPRVAATSNGYWVIWADARHWSSANRTSDLYGRFVSPTGPPTDASERLLVESTDSLFLPALAGNGNTFFAAWKTRPSGVWNDILVGSRFDSTGARLDNPPAVIATNLQDYVPFDVAPSGSRYIAAWPSRLSDGVSNALVIAPFPATAGGAPASVATLTNTPASLVIGTARDTGEHFLLANNQGMFLTAADQPKSPTLKTVLTDPPVQYRPSVAFDGTQYLVVWFDSREGFQIFGKRFTASGEEIDPQSFRISYLSHSGPEYAAWRPRVAFGDTNFLVVWQQTKTNAPPADTIYGTRVTSRGEVLDRPAIRIGAIGYAEDAPDVSFDGTQFVVTWQSSANYSYNIAAARVSTSGVLLDSPPLKITTGYGYSNDPRISSRAGTSLIVWSRQNTTADFARIYGARLDSNGHVLDVSPLPISTGANTHWTPAVAAGPTNFMVTWTDLRNGASRLFGARVTAGGTVQDPSGFPIVTGNVSTNSQYLPEILRDGDRYLTLWLDYRQDTETATGTFATIVSDSTSVSAPFLIGSGFTSSCCGWLASAVGGTGGGQFLVFRHRLTRGTIGITRNLVGLQPGLRLAIEKSPDGKASLRWFGEEGAVYQLQYKRELSLPSWTDAGPATEGTNGFILQFDAPDARRFYRVLQH